MILVVEIESNECLLDIKMMDVIIFLFVRFSGEGDSISGVELLGDLTCNEVEDELLAFFGGCYK